MTLSSFEFPLVALATLICLLYQPCASFSVGPPPLPIVCKSMTPQHHGYIPQNGPSPFKIFVDKADITAGSSLVVTLANIDNTTKFKGFYLQARDKKGKAIGQFTPNADTKVHNCFGKRANAAYHASGKVAKGNLTIVWTAPKENHDEIIMTATMMKDYVTYWVFLQSDSIKMVSCPVNLNSTHE